MAAVMIYQKGDPYGRSRYNPLALRAMVVDKLRERLLGLTFVPAATLPAGVRPTLADVLAGKEKGTLHDAYRQSWVASPETEYVAAGNGPLQASLSELQALCDRPLETTDVAGRAVPTAASGLSAAERELLQSRGVLDAAGRITPTVVTREAVDSPEKLLSPQLWKAIYEVPGGDVTIEHVQHSFYMAANYGFQILNGNFAAAIDDYELKLRFMNDLATYRIYVSWLWSLVHHRAPITKDGHLLRQELTADGVVLGRKAEPVAAGARFDRALFDKVFAYHDEWTAAFFAEQDRRGEPGRFDRSKAPVIMELLRRQLLSPRYVQHSARVLFIMGQAKPAHHAQILEAIFDLPRAEVLRRVQAGTMDRAALDAHDYALDLPPA
jgi:malate synthase